ncbi:hypothetical protein C923_02424 [Plasmodium falciparum UGT5.1]|uniref:Uncharacterized protein n=1 Tax=Plasmodium falciparum UGT5.1 TaxID=1237627 RepID=W7JDE4_PLAFA|nr:hypothetical protein C923_02424 [Plasmodium falciparum UGT5.1]
MSDQINVKHKIGDTCRKLYSYFKTVNNTSTFIQNGTLTPSEFVDSGDFLVYKFKTWELYIYIYIFSYVTKRIKKRINVYMYVFCFRHDLYLLFLLKFISGVIPTIEYDFTTDIEIPRDSNAGL